MTAVADHSKVDHLKKIVLELRTEAHSAEFEFIYGAASEGLCPFEYELLHRIIGDRMRLSVPRTRAMETFAHLFTPIRMALQLTELPDTLNLSVSIVSVSDAEPREIVRAIAQATEQHSCAGDCGCGCGGH